MLIVAVAIETGTSSCSECSNSDLSVRLFCFVESNSNQCSSMEKWVKEAEKVSNVSTGDTEQLVKVKQNAC